MSSVLAIIIDTTVCAWGELLQTDPDAIGNSLDVISSICNIFTAFSATNQLFSYTACKRTPVKTIFPSTSSAADDPGRVVTDAVTNALKDEAHAQSNQKRCPISGALATALCTFNRRRRDALNDSKSSYRIFIVTPTGVSHAQHVQLMNMFFGANKQKIVIDACVLGGEDDALLQQACDITGGSYIAARRTVHLLSACLMQLKLTGSVAHEATMPLGDVDYRPTCFCHRQLVDQGFVCSVCLSVCCAPTQICLTCKTNFNTNVLAIKRKQKNKAEKETTKKRKKD